MGGLGGHVRVPTGLVHLVKSGSVSLDKVRKHMCRDAQASQHKVKSCKENTINMQCTKENEMMLREQLREHYNKQNQIMDEMRSVFKNFPHCDQQHKYLHDRSTHFQRRCRLLASSR